MWASRHFAKTYLGKFDNSVLVLGLPDDTGAGATTAHWAMNGCARFMHRRITKTFHAEQVPMQFKHELATSPLMKAIDILRDDDDFRKQLLHPCNSMMSSIGLCILASHSHSLVPS